MKAFHEKVAQISVIARRSLDFGKYGLFVDQVNKEIANINKKMKRSTD